MLKKFVVVIIIVVLAVICAVAAPWQNWNITIFSFLGLAPPTQLARLQVTSLAGELEILVDGQTKGSVGPEGSPFIIEDIEPGQRLVKLVRVSETDGAYTAFERLLNFNQDIDTVIAYELGPTEEFSEGTVITAFRSFSNDQRTTLNIETSPGDVKASLNGQDIGLTNLEGIEIDISNIARIKLEKQGYETIELNLLPEDSAQREKLKGYEIQLEANLFLIPIRIGE